MKPLLSGKKTVFSVKIKMLSKVLSWQRAQENMSVEGSQPIVHLRGASKEGFLAKKGHLKRLRPPATACDRELPQALQGTF